MSDCSPLFDRLSTAVVSIVYTYGADTERAGRMCEDAGDWRTPFASTSTRTRQHLGPTASWATATRSACMLFTLTLAKHSFSFSAPRLRAVSRQARFSTSCTTSYATDVPRCGFRVRCESWPREDHDVQTLSSTRTRSTGCCAFRTTGGQKGARKLRRQRRKNCLRHAARHRQRCAISRRFVVAQMPVARAHSAHSVCCCVAIDPASRACGGSSCKRGSRVGAAGHLEERG